jgi:HAMP domain-containing protein
MKKNISAPGMRPKNGLQPNNSDQIDGRKLLAALTSFKRGDFSERLPDDWTGIAGKIADTFNDTIRINQRLTEELERIRRVVGKEGRIRQRASLGEVSGSWSEAMRSVNALIEDLVHPTSEMARVIGAVARGNLSETMATEIEGRPLEGEFLRTAKIVNTMVRQLSAFASEVTRVAREVGIEGKLGGQTLQSKRPIVGIALTGFGMEDDIRKGRKAGFQNHLVKPIDLNRLDLLIQESANPRPPQ